MLWHFAFYHVESDGARIGGDKVTDGSPSIEQAIAQAKSMLQSVIFPFGRANLCLIKSQDGNLVREVTADT
jgi:hypothetical protein